MYHLIIGILCTAIFFLLMNKLRDRGIKPGLWKTLLMILEFIFIIFVLELTYGFVEEGALKGGLVMGLVFGFPCIVTGLLISRWIYKTPSHEV